MSTLIKFHRSVKCPNVLDVFMNTTDKLSGYWTNIGYDCFHYVTKVDFNPGDTKILRITEVKGVKTRRSRR